MSNIMRFSDEKIHKIIWIFYHKLIMSSNSNTLDKASFLSTYSQQSKSNQGDLDAKQIELSIKNNAKNMCGTQRSYGVANEGTNHTFEQILNWFQDHGIMMGNPADIYDNYVDKCKQTIREEVKKCLGERENTRCQSKLFLNRKVSLVSNLSVKL